MLLNLFIICLVNVLIIDLSGIIDEIKLFISKWLTKDKIKTKDFRLKPFDCSFCMTFWSGLIFTLVIGQFTLVNLLIILLLAYLTGVIKECLTLIKDLLIKLIDTLYETFKIRN